MGRHTYHDVMPFVAHNVWNGRGDSPIPDEIRDAFFPEFDEEFAGDDEVANGWAQINGWIWRGDGIDCGNRGRLFGNEWTKGEYTVWTINQSPYASVSVYSFAVCSNSKAAIQAFFKDHNLQKVKIYSNDSVEQTL